VQRFYEVLKKEENVLLI